MEYSSRHFIPDNQFFDKVFIEWEDDWLRPIPVIDTPAYHISSNLKDWQEYYTENRNIQFMGLYQGHEMVGYISYIKLIEPTNELLSQTFCSNTYTQLISPIKLIFIEALFIRQKYRNMGYGKKLLELFHTHLDELGLPYLVETNSKNLSVKLYQNNGYREFGRVYEHRENGEDTVTYIREIKPKEM